MSAQLVLVERMAAARADVTAVADRLRDRLGGRRRRDVVREIVGQFRLAV